MQKIKSHVAMAYPQPPRRFFPWDHPETFRAGPNRMAVTLQALRDEARRRGWEDIG